MCLFGIFIKKIYFVLLMNYKYSLNSDPDIASSILKNLKNGLSERRDNEEESELNKIIRVPTSTRSINKNFTNIPLKQQFSFTKLKRNIENFGDVYDKRTKFYDECEGVGDIIKKIRKGDYNSWKSDPRVEQIDCEPVYDWDGKFYKDEKSALKNKYKERINYIIKKEGTALKNMTESECQQWVDDNPDYSTPDGLGGTWSHIPQGCVANSTGKTHYNRKINNKECGSNGYNCVEKELSPEKIMRPTDDGNLGKIPKDINDDRKKKYPGINIREQGNFIMSSVMSDDSPINISLNNSQNNYKGVGWNFKKGTKDNWIQMETVSGKIEMIKGVVTQGHDTNKHYVKKFKVFVSRNGDSWKQVKNSNGQLEFIGHNDGNYKDRESNKFDESVEAKYIRIYPTDSSNNNLSLRLGYIKDLSGIVKCKGGSGMLKEEDKRWFRFTFNEEKTKSNGVMSQGTHRNTKKCPNDGEVMIAYKSGTDINYISDFDRKNIKIFYKDSIEPINQVIPQKDVDDCETDPSSTGWYSSENESSFSWSECFKPDMKTPDMKTPAYNKDHKGYRYMYRNWDTEGKSPTDYKKYITEEGKGSIENTQSENANNGSTYNAHTSDININGYENFEKIKQPCNRGTKGVIPTIEKSEWISTVPYIDGVETNNAKGGYMGKIQNYTGGTEGWIDKPIKYTIDNNFNGTIKAENTTDSNIYYWKYKVIEKVGTNANDDTNSWGSNDRGDKGINDTYGQWYSPTKANGGEFLNTSTTNESWSARYDDKQKFVPIGIKIQPASETYSPSWNALSPTVIRFKLSYPSSGEKTPFLGPQIVLGPFTNANEIKTILIHPDVRKKFIDNNYDGTCSNFHVLTRHGRGASRTCFRINFLIGRTGDGNNSIETKYVTAGIPSPNKPVDCTSTYIGEEMRYSNHGDWSDWSECSNKCGGKGKKIRKRNRTAKRFNKYEVVAATYGGKFDCKAYELVETGSDVEQKEESCYGYCPGTSCQHCEEGAICRYWSCSKKSKWHGWEWNPW
jgi:hypothetical protein